MKISITGDLGSGKTTVAKLICEQLGYSYFSTGAIQRDLAQKLGVDTLSLNKLSEKDRKIDDLVDSALAELNHKESPFVIDARMGWFFIPSSFKVYLYVDLNIAAERVVNDAIRNSEKYEDIAAGKAQLAARKASEHKRFSSLYKVDSSSFDNYDLVVDTSQSTPSEIAEVVIEKFNRWKTNHTIIKTWFSPLSLYPTHGVRQLAGEPSQIITASIKQAGYDEAFPIDVVRSNGYFFIIDGHKRTSAALFNKLNLVPINIIASDRDMVFPTLSADQYANNECSLSMIYDWEDCHKFLFKDYPKLT